MKKYFFTFPHDCISKNGQVFLGRSWVEVIAEDYGTARMHFVELFTTSMLVRPLAFAFQYPDDKCWDPQYLSDGCYAKIENNILTLQ